jgi:hypothetical protein
MHWRAEAQRAQNCYQADQRFRAKRSPAARRYCRGLFGPRQRRPPPSVPGAGLAVGATNKTDVTFSSRIGRRKKRGVPDPVTLIALPTWPANDSDSGG